VGLPAALGGSNRLERFLAPSFAGGEVQAAESEEASGSDTGLELGLMATSTVVALGGIGLAAFFFLLNRRAADRAAERFAGLHRVLSNKYYVDEIYDATIVQPIRIVAEDGLWKGIDVGLIDRAVNGVGQAVRGSGQLLRRLQTGSVRAYAVSLFLGVVLILGYYMWR
jgi:NADH-quinone oxidoreductase subunit L